MRHGVGGQLHGLPVLDHCDVVLGQAGFVSQLRVQEQLPVLAVHGDEEARPHRVEHLAQLIALRVPRHVDVADLGVEHPRAVAVQVVHRLVHHPLVARNRPRGDDHPVVPVHVDERMTLRGEACQRRHRLALAARGQEEQLRRWNPLVVGEGDREPIWHFEKTELARSLEVLLQAAADHHDPAIELGRHAHEVLDAVNVGREVGDDDAARGLAEDLLKGRVQVALGPRAALSLGVGRITEQQQHAGVTDLAKAIHVGGQAVRWGRVELEVARIDHAPDRCVDGEADRVRDGVAYGDRLHTEWPELDRIAEPDLAQV